MSTEQREKCGFCHGGMLRWTKFDGTLMDEPCPYCDATGFVGRAVTEGQEDQHGAEK